MKVIFLDIDGVLNSLDNMRAMTLFKRTEYYKLSDEYGHLFDNRCVMWLRWIIAETNANIVISSTWRSQGLIKMQTMWEMRDLPGEVIDITPTYVEPHIINLYACSNNEADRGYEIQQWIEEHKPSRYCIVDDDSDMLLHQKKFFVKTNSDIGIDMKAARSIVAILNEVEIINHDPSPHTKDHL